MTIGVRLGSWSIPTLDRRRIIGLVLAAIAALMVLALTRPANQVAVLVAGDDLVAGQPLSEEDVTVRYVANGEGLVVGVSLGDLEDWSLRAPLQSGEPLVPSLLQAPQLAAYPNVIALSLDKEHAVLGNLVAGDRVDVYRTTSHGFDAAPITARVASDVYVIQAAVATDGINSDRVDLLLAVDETLAALIAGAARGGEIDLVRIAP